jgi:hypothetical protein
MTSWAARYVKVAVATEGSCEEGEGTVVNWFLLA